MNENAKNMKSVTDFRFFTCPASETNRQGIGGEELLSPVRKYFNTYSGRENSQICKALY